MNDVKTLAVNQYLTLKLKDKKTYIYVGNKEIFVWKFNSVIAPNGNPFEQPINDLLNYAKELPKAHKDKMLHQKMDEMFTKGIDVRLLNKDEYISHLKAKVRRGQKIFLFDPFKPTTEEEIEEYKDEV